MFAWSIEELICLANQYRIALMCADAVLWRCHRSLIADALLVRGIRTEDIMSATHRQAHTLTYVLNQWDALCVYTTDGDLNIDNNVSENALRWVAVGRKNWLFCGSEQKRTASITTTRQAAIEWLEGQLRRMNSRPSQYLLGARYSAY